MRRGCWGLDEARLALIWSLLKLGERHIGFIIIFSVFLYMFEIFHILKKKKKSHGNACLSSPAILWDAQGHYPALSSRKHWVPPRENFRTQAAQLTCDGEKKTWAVSRSETSFQQSRKQNHIYSMIISKKYKQKLSTEKGVKNSSQIKIQK